VHHLGWLGDRTTLARTLASADACLHGSAAETYGLAVAEAVCAGLPVVAPDRGGAAALVRAGAGELYSAGDAKGCAAAILRLLARDRHELAAATRTAARTIDPIDFHFANLFARYEQLRGAQRRAA
jgi:alpha-1,6-mannosyltransferase